MKQVIIYNQIQKETHGGQRYVDDELRNFLCCQIDISLHLGWNPDDIILGTNFDFEYKGVKSYILNDVCEWSGFHNFWYGAIELMERGILTKDFWLHDHDSWPIKKFNFPKFAGEVAGCEYVGTSEWNCASIYCKSSSLETLQYIKDALIMNKEIEMSSDEVMIAILRKNYNPIQSRLTSINTRYNVGVTHGELRRDAAERPINVLSFNPAVEKGRRSLVNTKLYDEIPIDILDILKKYFPL